MLRTALFCGGCSRGLREVEGLWVGDFKSRPPTAIGPKYGVDRALTYLQCSSAVPNTGWGSDPRRCFCFAALAWLIEGGAF